MKIHKEIVWNKGENPKKDGKYLIAQFWDDGSLLCISDVYYTVASGWNTHATDTGFGWGQNPQDGAYVWAELPF